MLTGQHNVHRLSAGMMTLGYTGTFFGNLVGGALWDTTHAPLTAFAPAILGALVMVAFAVRRSS
jgi:uncharacterized membrane protein YeaQ/YmgE (transglycosylase-associated protein family)